MPTSAAACRALLRILPRSFCDEFADEMAEVFLDQARRTSGAGRAGLWLTTIATVTGLAVRLRVDQLRLDLKHALRGLWRQKVFTAAAVLTLALALGPATAVFSRLRHIVLDPMPGADVDRVVYVWAENPTRNLRQFPWSELNFLDYQARQRGLSALAACTATSATVGGEVPQQLLGTWVAPEMFSVLGITPALGWRPISRPDGHLRPARPRRYRPSSPGMLQFLAVQLSDC